MAAKVFEKRYYQNANLPVVVPGLNVIFEDLVIALAAGMIGLSLSSLLGYVSTFASVFVNVSSFILAVFLLAFARSRRTNEIAERGICRAGVLRRYLAYMAGSDRLRGR